MKHPILIYTAAFLLTGSLPLFSQGGKKQVTPSGDSATRALIHAMSDNLLNGEWFRSVTGYDKKDSTTIDTILISHKRKRIQVFADKQLSYFPAREEVVDSIEAGLVAGAGMPWEGYRMEVFSNKRNIRELVPNSYRGKQAVDAARIMRRSNDKTPPLVRDLSRSYLEDASLYKRHIALWHSHGMYYESSLSRWEWQRARLFQTVEDIYPMSFTLPFLVPMLENAGARVLMPRERDWQPEEVIVDNDGSTGRSMFIGSVGEDGPDKRVGFGWGEPPYALENPFRLGTFREMPAAKKANQSMQWVPDIPADGSYAVYVSYGDVERNADDARYEVHHAGGVTTFLVNQQMGAGTWVYLGKFCFHKGMNPQSGKVFLSNASGLRKAVVTGDAVRFGGGMGIIQRDGMTSLRPRYQEGARYYLQFAGFPDSLVWKLNGDGEDYKDDYQSKGEWVSYLMGSADNKKSKDGKEGLGIPVDMALAFHSDAGISYNDTVIGTLGIYSSTYKKGDYPTGLSRMASRDLADLVQTQIVEDLRELWDPAWTRRAIWDKPYSEAFRPNTPTMLLELFSHQNFLDMRFGQEPLFRFHVSRAIYKGLLRFMSGTYGVDYVVQPLPVSHFRTAFTEEGHVALDWKAVEDPLEPTAKAEKFRVYTRINQGGFDTGLTVEGCHFVLEDPHEDSIYSFRVTALNAGGESFPSEVLSVCLRKGAKGLVGIVSAFDRVSGPAWFEDSAHAGFMPMIDRGVAWGMDLHTVGDQFDYEKTSPWLDDDSPGHGASYADLEGTLIPGNTFDFTTIHGKHLVREGYSYVSISDECLLEDSLDLEPYLLLDYLAGEERSTYFPKEDSMAHFQVFPEGMAERLGDYLAKGGSLFISGAHIASDAHLQGQDSLVAVHFGIKWRTSNASRKGKFYVADPEYGAYSRDFSFNTTLEAPIYAVEGADALEPADEGSFTLMRYRENNMSAAVASRTGPGVVVLGFPFETIPDEEERNEIMHITLKHIFERKANEQNIEMLLE